MALPLAGFSNQFEGFWHTGNRGDKAISTIKELGIPYLLSGWLRRPHNRMLNRQNAPISNGNPRLIRKMKIASWDASNVTRTPYLPWAEQTIMAGAFWWGSLALSCTVYKDKICVVKKNKGKGKKNPWRCNRSRMCHYKNKMGEKAHFIRWNTCVYNVPFTRLRTDGVGNR